MKLKLLLCGAALLVAGCSSTQNPLAGTEGLSYVYDELPQPVPDLTPGFLDTLYEVSPTGVMQPASGALNPGGGASQ